MTKNSKTMNLNFGPQHPAAHGVLRLILELVILHGWELYYGMYYAYPVRLHVLGGLKKKFA